MFVFLGEESEETVKDNVLSGLDLGQPEKKAEKYLERAEGLAHLPRRAVGKYL